MAIASAAGTLSIINGTSLDGVLLASLLEFASTNAGNLVESVARTAVVEEEELGLVLSWFPLFSRTPVDKLIISKLVLEEVVLVLLAVSPFGRLFPDCGSDQLGVDPVDDDDEIVETGRNCDEDDDDGLLVVVGFLLPVVLSATLLVVLVVVVVIRDVTATLLPLVPALKLVKLGTMFGIATGITFVEWWCPGPSILLSLISWST